MPLPTNPDDLIHPMSRKAKRIHKAETHQKRLVKRVVQSNKKHGPELRKMAWFQEHMAPGKNVFSRREICELIHAFLHRNSENDETPEASGEIEKFREGNFTAPDLTNGKAVKALRGWKGDWSTITSIKTGRFRDPGDLGKNEMAIDSG
eukprot:CAMPEP_0114550660 /NCGR_PEP_ID=MMETSP0114-20121206/6187_1 /TAXON_ID=31324 /ORGANISM="Goniomonas sp, Strain m" /LENGTH=148 /DNA_ID=CAMNT_0001735439 /DNA_START=3 /DNA_END=445 /DNA_ORIENTATION=-